jgi:hypothetical protein
MSPPGEGQGIEKDADHSEATDPDGWDEVRQGRIPRVKTQ